LLLRPAGAQEEGPTPNDMQAGSLLMRMSQGYVTATLLNTDVNVVVNGMVARVSVMQEFENSGQEWVEGVYVFPLPDAAAVDRMRLYIGDRFIEGEIREKEQAKKEYEQAKAEGKKTSLVEQQRANLFTTSVANIAPGEKVIIEIEYLENLKFEEGAFSLRYPMTLTPRYIPGQGLDDRQGSGSTMPR
jgi:Ca-activated chloride channel family protein